jgi:dienelactone hydrolase
MKSHVFLWGVIFALGLTGCVSNSPKVTDLALGQSGWIRYPSSTESISLSGELLFPNDSGRNYPVMILAHGSGGLDNRSENWANFFRQNGYATFKMDYFGPRGVHAKSTTQPVPTNDVFDAVKLLATHPRIDRARIGVIGFSRGGHLAINSASPGTRDLGGNTIAAHVGLYPTCGLTEVGRDKLKAPILVLVGSDDDIAPYVQCEVLIDRAKANGRDARLIVYEGANHSWDDDYTGTYCQPSLNTCYRMRADSALTERSQRDVLEFLRTAMKR